MIKSIQTAFMNCFRPLSLTQGGRPRAASRGSHYGQPRRRLNRAASPVLEALEDRRLLAAFVVDTLIDQNDGVGTGGISLRDAIVAANTSNGADTIAFAPGLTAGGPGTITLTFGQLSLTDTTGATTITGPGANLLSVSGNSASRVFRIASDVTSQISGLTVKDGRALGTNDPDYAGGGILNQGTLTISNSTLSGNSAPSEFGLGGGIANDGTLTVINSTFSGNSAAQDGGGISNRNGRTLTVTGSTFSGNTTTSGGAIRNHGGGTLTVGNSTFSNNTASDGDGGGISSSGTLTLSNSTFSGNTAFHGGGISNNFSTGTITNTTLSGNTAKGAGGIYNSGTLTISGSTISNNTVVYAGGLNDGNDAASGNGAGGGIFNHAAGALTITNSTLSGNTASYSGSISDEQYGSGNGGGVYNRGTLTISNSTLAGNTAALPGETREVVGSGSGGGIFNHSDGTLTINNTIVAANTARANRDVHGAVSSGGFNLIGDGSGMTGLTNGANGNQVGTLASPIDPKLGPLANNGGPTQTMALLAGSPARHAGSNALIAGGVTTDQRGTGFDRIVGSSVDIGAFEFDAAATPTDTIAPVAKSARLAGVKAGKKPYVFKIVYTDSAGVDAATIGNRNILVTGPRKFKQWASMVSKPAASAGRIVVTYQVTAPGKIWGSEDNGAYTIWLWAGRVKDGSGNASGKKKLGSFKANLRSPQRAVARAVSASPAPADARRPATAAGLFNTTSCILMDGVSNE